MFFILNLRYIKSPSTLTIHKGISGHWVTHLVLVEAAECYHGNQQDNPPLLGRCMYMYMYMYMYYVDDCIVNQYPVGWVWLTMKR